jgi:hypothetical protein
MNDVAGDLRAVKLTDYARRYAEHAMNYIGPCPWNPFPRNSHWGRMIDDAYRRDELCRRRAIFQSEGNT